MSLCCFQWPSARIADVEVEAAASALAVLERRLDKTILRAPADGVVSVIVAEVDENIRAGQPVLVIAEAGKQFLSLNARDDLLHGLTVGTSVNVRRSGAAEKTSALVPATPARHVRDLAGRACGGGHDRNTLRLRLDLQGDPTGFEPGVSVGMQLNLRPAAVIRVHPLRRRLPLNGAAFNIR